LIKRSDFIEFPAEKYFEIFSEAYKKISEGIQISALSIDTQGETLIVCDERGKPLRNAIVWLDNRATKEAKIIEEHFSAKRIYEITGQPETPAGFPAPKLLWIKNNEPEIWAKTRKIMLLEDYILFRLTGNFVTERTLQSSSLYFDITKADYWKEMLDFIGIGRSYLPELKNSGDIVGYYGKTAVVAGALDQIAGITGAGVVKQGMISEMTGTTMAVCALTDKIPDYNPESKVPCHYNATGNYCLMLWSPTAGMALEWFKNNFCENIDFKELDNLAEKIPAGSEGLTMLPYLCGSTMPEYNPKIRGVFYGIDLKHTKAHFARSILESVACMLKSYIDFLGMDIKEIRAMGGGASSALWCQIKSDMTGKKICTLKNNETACLGSAIFAGVGIGLYPSIEDACQILVKTGKEYRPSGTDYNDVYKRYSELDSLLNKKTGGN
jgi:xylulokinase